MTQTHDITDNPAPELCYYCEEPLGQDGTADWCWIKRGPDGCGLESYKVHDSCAVPLIETARKIRELAKASPAFFAHKSMDCDPVPAIVAELEKAGITIGDLDSAVYDTANQIAADVNDKDMEAQARFLMSNGYDPRKLVGLIAEDTKG